MNSSSTVSQVSSPYLSVVAASRNDDHGGDPLIRTQIFINSLARQCEKYRLPAELIIVDWNPVPNRPGLAAVLDLPADAPHFQARVVTVPTALHQRLKYSEQLPLFQMIAKNVGIRRARGEFILATNIDIIFSNELIQFLAKQKLDPKEQYRVDRYDIHKGLSKDFTLDETLEYAWANPIRTNRRYCPEKLVNHLYGKDLFKQKCRPDKAFHGKTEGVMVTCEDDVWQIRPDCSVPMSHLHTNACGDFTLLSREAWDVIRGYPEFSAYSFNIDSMGLISAHYAGYREVSLLPPCVCFHIEHGIGSGWTPEGEKKLFNRLRDAEILNPEWPVLTPLVDEMRITGKVLEFNHAGWGMDDFDLPEQALGDTKDIPIEKLERLAFQSRSRDVSAIQPAYDLDRLTLMYERRLEHERNLTGTAGVGRMDLYNSVAVGIKLSWSQVGTGNFLKQDARITSIVTPPKAWHYAAVASMGFSRRFPSEQGAVRVLASVKNAKVGLGLLNNDGDMIKRVEVLPLDGPQEIFIKIDNIGKLKQFVVQSWDQNKAAEVEILEFSICVSPHVYEQSLKSVANMERVVIYIPDSRGNYSEQNIISYHLSLLQTTTVYFRLEKFAHQFPLRLDLSQELSLTSISSITAFDIDNGRRIMIFPGPDAKKIAVSGTAVLTNPALSKVGRWKQMLFGTNNSDGQKLLYVLSTGQDPQLILPPLPENIGFPLELSIEMRFMPFK